MAYRLKTAEPVPEAIKRIVLEEIESAEQYLNHGHADAKKRGEAVHGARKSIKKIRAILRLMRPEIGRTYRAENRRLRSVARKLSQIRDAKATVEVFDSVLEKYKDNLQNNTLNGIRRGLERSRRETEQAANVPKVVENAAATLRAAGRRVKSWPLKSDGFSAIAPGLKTAYRNGRAAMSAAAQNPRPENYHEWRKRVKDHWYHIRLLENLWTEVMQAREGSLKNLETWLGDDHNLVVLCGHLDNEPEKYGDPKDIQLFRSLVDTYQKELRENAMSLGQRIYEEKPKQFAQNLSKLWDAWQQQPDSMKEVEKQQQQPPKKQPGQAAPAKAKKSAA